MRYSIYNYWLRDSDYRHYKDIGHDYVPLPEHYALWEWDSNFRGLPGSSQFFTNRLRVNY